MGFVYTKKEKQEDDGKTLNVMEYVNRMFNQQAKKEVPAEAPKIESTK